MTKPQSGKTVVTLTYDEAKRTNIPTAEYESVMRKEEQSPIRLAYERRNRDLDPQLVWRGKDEQDWSNLVVHAPPLYIQEKIQPKVLIDDLLKQAKDTKAQEAGFQADLFADLNGIHLGVNKTEFYRHDANWWNRMILNKTTPKGKWQCRCRSAKSMIVQTLSLSIECRFIYMTRGWGYAGSRNRRLAAAASRNADSGKSIVASVESMAR